MSKYKSKAGQDVVNTLFSESNRLKAQVNGVKGIRVETEPSFVTEELQAPAVKPFYRNYAPDDRPSILATSSVMPDRFKNAKKE